MWIFGHHQNCMIIIIRHDRKPSNTALTIYHRLSSYKNVTGIMLYTCFTLEQYKYDVFRHKISLSVSKRTFLTVALVHVLNPSTWISTWDNKYFSLVDQYLRSTCYFFQVFKHLNTVIHATGVDLDNAVGRERISERKRVRQPHHWTISTCIYLQVSTFFQGFLDYEGENIVQIWSWVPHWLLLSNE